jgi:hypothetical protein
MQTGEFEKPLRNMQTHVIRAEEEHIRGNIPSFDHLVRLSLYTGAGGELRESG